MTHIDLIALLTILRDNGVYHYKTPDLELEIHPLIKQESIEKRLSMDEMDQILFHSAE